MGSDAPCRKRSRPGCWVEDALGGKLLLLVLCAVVAWLAPPWQAELLSSAFLGPPAPPRAIWVRSPSLVLSFSKLIARMLPCLTRLSREGTGAFSSFAVAVGQMKPMYFAALQAGSMGVGWSLTRRGLLPGCLPGLQRAPRDGRKSPLAKEKAGGSKAPGWDQMNA